MTIVRCKDSSNLHQTNTQGEYDKAKKGLSLGAWCWAAISCGGRQKKYGISVRHTAREINTGAADGSIVHLRYQGTTTSPVSHGISS
jgi:hypothetical protein